jgi:hypothetical protein
LICNRVGSPRLASIRRGHVGCKSCANNGRGMVDATLARQGHIDAANATQQYLACMNVKHALNQMTSP